jgi:hypothetical protein
MQQNALLEEWKARNEQSLARLKKAVEDKNEAELNQQPNPKTWSPLQVIEHLVKSNPAYLKTIETALQQAHPVGETAEVRFTFIGSRIAYQAGPQGSAPAPPNLRPRNTTVPYNLLAEWEAQQRQLLALLECAKGKDLSGTRVRNPLIKIIPMNLADCFAILTGHTERHVGQIEQRIPR